MSAVTIYHRLAVEPRQRGVICHPTVLERGWTDRQKNKRSQRQQTIVVADLLSLTHWARNSRIMPTSHAGDLECLRILHHSPHNFNSYQEFNAKSASEAAPVRYSNSIINAFFY